MMKLQVKVIKIVPDYTEQNVNEFLAALNPKKKTFAESNTYAIIMKVMMTL